MTAHVVLKMKYLRLGILSQMKSVEVPVMAVLSLFGLSYSCEQLFSAINYLISDTKTK